jgi:hypothetical protein
VCRDASIRARFFWAGAPHKTNTTGVSLALTALITA